MALFQTLRGLKRTAALYHGQDSMADQGMKSRPRYERLDVDRSGKRHLLIAEQSTVPVEALVDGLLVDSFNERWTIAGHSLAIPTPDENCHDHAFRSREHLLIALERRLREEHMGFRLYAVGTEAFLWSINALAHRFGLGRNEIQLFALGNAARRVFCNHCRATTEKVTTSIIVCSGCGAHLYVRDHFSRRLNAFAGVQVDAEAPGEVPEIEELYS